MNPSVFLVVLLAVSPVAGRAQAPPVGDPPLSTVPSLRTSAAESTISRRVAELKKKIESEPADSIIWVSLGDALMQQARDAADARVYREAEAAYENALQSDPKSAEAFLGLAWVHNTEHQFDEGKRFAGRALELNPKLQHAHALLGDAAVELGDYDLAFEHYQEALDLRPDLASYGRAAHLLWLTGNATRARWLMQKAIDAGGPYPENAAWCRAELGLMLFRSGVLVSAEKQLQQALEKAPDNYHVLAAMARIKTAQKKYDEAIELYKRSIAGTATHDALVSLGDLYALTGRSAQAEVQFQRVIAMHTNGVTHSHDGGPVHVHASEDGNAQLARFYADHDRNLEDALHQAKLAYRRYKNVFVITTLAWCYYKNGSYQEAEKTIRKALQWRTPDSEILFRAGMIYAKLEDRRSARKYLYQALNLNPHFHPSDSVVAARMLEALASRPNIEPASGAKETSAAQRP